MTQISRSFRREEFASKCGRLGYDTVDAELLTILQEARDHFQKPIHILSGTRSPEHNKAVGGAGNSQHLTGRAADIVVRDIPPNEVADYFEQKYPSKYGIGRYKSFTHIDTRSGYSARWKG